MWGAEGERIEQQRLASRTQYAADLQKQIEEQYGRRDNSFRESPTKQVTQRPPEPQQQTFATPGPDYSAEMSVDMRQNSGWAVLPKRDTNAKLEVKVKELQNTVDRIITVDLPMRVKPQEEAISALFSKVDQIGNQSRDAVQSVREKMAELSLNVNNLTQKTSDQNEKIRNAVIEMKGDASRARDVCDSITGKMGQFEARLAQVEDLVRGLVSRQQQIEQNMNEQYSQMSNAIATVQKNANSANRHMMSQIEQVNREAIASVGRMNQALQDTGMAFNESLAALAREAKDSFNIVRSECDDELAALKQQLDSTTDEISQSFTALQSEVVQTFSTFKGILESDMQTLEHSLAQEIHTRKENDQRLEDAQKTLLVGVNTQLTGVSANVTRIEKDIQSRVEVTCNTYFEKWKGDLSAYLKDSLETITECRTLVDSNLEKVLQVNKEHKELEATVKEFSSRLETQAGSFGNQLSAVSIELTRAMNTQADDMRKEFNIQNEELQRSIRNQNDNFEPRIAKLENKYQKNKQAQKDNTVSEDVTMRVDRLEDICGDDPIPPQLEKLNENMAKNKARVVPLIGLDARLDRLEKESERNSSIIERIVRLETVQSILKDQPQQQYVQREIQVQEVKPVEEVKEEPPKEEPPKEEPKVVIKVAEEEEEEEEYTETPPQSPEPEPAPAPAPAQVVAVVVPPKPDPQPEPQREPEPDPEGIPEVRKIATPVEPQPRKEPRKYIFEEYPDDVGIPDVAGSPAPEPEPEPATQKKKPRVVDEAPADFGIPDVAPAPADDFGIPQTNGGAAPAYRYSIDKGTSVTIPAKKPVPGDFVLHVAEPQFSDEPGLRLAMPGRAVPFLYKGPTPTEPPRKAPKVVKPQPRQKPPPQRQPAAKKQPPRGRRRPPAK